MSSEGSSSRADLGNAFEGDSLSSSTLRGRQTLEFSWTDSSRRESTSRQDDAVEGSPKPVGERDEVEVSSSGHVEWSCVHDVSTLTDREACRLVESYKIEVIVPRELCRVHQHPRGYVTVSKAFFKFGVRFSLNQFFRDILRFCGLTVFQVTPNE